MNTKTQIEYLREAQEHLSDAARLIRQVCRSNEYHGDRIRSYILGHLEPLIGNEHDWLGRSVSLEDIIEEIKEDDIEEYDLEDEE